MQLLVYGAASLRVTRYRFLANTKRKYEKGSELIIDNRSGRKKFGSIFRSQLLGFRF